MSQPNSATWRSLAQNQGSTNRRTTVVIPITAKHMSEILPLQPSAPNHDKANPTSTQMKNLRQPMSPWFAGK
ncbi:MAG: hypothetical protein U1G08_15090 [Verrucomicrobiota bacterium]